MTVAFDPTGPFILRCRATTNCDFAMTKKTVDLVRQKSFPLRIILNPTITAQTADHSKLVTRGDSSDRQRQDKEILEISKKPSVFALI